MMTQRTQNEHAWRPRLAGSVAVLLLAACASLEPMPGGTVGAELMRVPFFRQQVYQCGPAALATVLVDAGVDVTPDALVPLVYVPARQGSLQVDMLAAPRHFGVLAYPLDGGLAGMLAEIDGGHPVVVLQNLGVSWYPRWHYAVLVGYDANADELVLRSGVTERYVIERSRFLRTWQRAEQWAFVVLEPGQFPARVNEQRYFEALAALEAVGQVAAAQKGYEAMIARWPRNADARFGLGNLLFAQGRIEEARLMYQAALETKPDHVGAANNLAMSWLRIGCADRALEIASTTLAGLDSSNPLYAAVGETAAEARSAQASDLAEDVCDADHFENDENDEHDADHGEGAATRR